MNLNQLIAIPGNINTGLTSARQATMLSLLGNPRSQYNQNCQGVTNTKLSKLIVRGDLGIFKVTGLRPAVESLKRIVADIKTEKPEVYKALGHMGMLCVRNQRGSATAISNHSWGTAIDLTMNGVLDAPGNNKVQRGLAEIAPIFNRHKWYWGAAFGREDGMHFEASEQLIRGWANDGTLSGEVVVPPKPLLTLGDRGPEVKLLQEKLNEITKSKLVADGSFGPGTFAAVVAFQGARGLTPDGAVGQQTWAALGL